MKNKPIHEGYKTWMVAQEGYTFTWLWHSRAKGPENIPKEGIQVPKTISLTGYLVPTFAVALAVIHPSYCPFFSHTDLPLHSIFISD